MALTKMVPSQMSPGLRVTRDLFKFFTWPGFLAQLQIERSRKPAA